MTQIAIMFIARCLTCIAAVAGAVYLVSIDKEGWGWLLFFAFSAIPGYTSDPEKTTPKETP